MKKREIIYLHGLLGEIRVFLVTRESVAEQHFEAYEEFGVGPTSIHRTKGEHQEAVSLLLDGLVSALVDERSDQDAEEASVSSR